MYCMYIHVNGIIYRNKNATHYNGDEANHGHQRCKSLENWTGQKIIVPGNPNGNRKPPSVIGTTLW